MLKERDYVKQITTFLTEQGINFTKIAPSLYMKSGVPDIQGTFENGKIFRIEVKRFNKKNYSATLLQQYNMLKAAKNHEIVFYINSTSKFESFKNYVLNKNYL